MEKQGVMVRLTGIDYGGGNVGSDTEFALSVNAKQTTVRADMTNGLFRNFDRVLFQQEVAVEGDVTVTVSATVTEGREAHPDSGSNSAEYTVKKAGGRQRLEPLMVQVQENRGKQGPGPVATFAIGLEAEYLADGGPGVKYVVGTAKGWLTAQPEDGTDPLSVPYGIKVKVTRVENGREYFEVMEGAPPPRGLKGRKGSVKLDNGVSNLSGAPFTREPGVTMVYHKKSLQLEVPGLGQFPLVEPYEDPLPTGKTFDLEVPFEPKPGGHGYDATFATSWFRMPDPTGSRRYLHTGSASAGCATVKAVDQWDRIYRYLINRRLDSRRVGKLKVSND
ncbi:MAG TPA: hypothetical protein VGK74_23345 [Symbiobacteriaceae bacterium]